MNHPYETIMKMCLKLLRFSKAYMYVSNSTLKFSWCLRSSVEDKYLDPCFPYISWSQCTVISESCLFVTSIDHIISYEENVLPSQHVTVIMNIIVALSGITQWNCAAVKSESQFQAAPCFDFAPVESFPSFDPSFHYDAFLLCFH